MTEYKYEGSYAIPIKKELKKVPEVKEEVKPIKKKKKSKV